MKPFFSIVVPCCNVGKYVRECLDSIQKQPFSDWECLCIIEDSTDDTESIVREFADNDKRFCVFTQPRSGSVSVPRNVGTEKATGEYIIFCDGDDSIAENSLAKIAKRINERPGADIYACAIWEYKDGGEFIRIIDNFLPNSPAELSGHDAVLLLYNFWKKTSPMLQENVWRRDFLNMHNLRCIPGLFNQDSEFFPRALYYAQRIVPLHDILYLYRRHSQCITLRSHKVDFRLQHWAVILKSLFAFHARESVKPGFDKQVAKCWAREWLDQLYDKWFRLPAIKSIPREKRLETLRIMFADGFDDLNKIGKMASFSKRMGLIFVKLFVLHKSLCVVIEMLFDRIFFPLADIKHRRGKHFLVSHEDYTR